jgi:hypothetical protein
LPRCEKPTLDLIRPVPRWSTKRQLQRRVRARRRALLLPAHGQRLGSRYLLTCEAVSITQEVDAFTVFARVFKEFGLPRAIRTDNGVPLPDDGAIQPALVAQQRVLLPRVSSPMSAPPYRWAMATRQRAGSIPETPGRAAKSPPANGCRCSGTVEFRRNDVMYITPRPTPPTTAFDGFATGTVHRLDYASGMSMQCTAQPSTAAIQYRSNSSRRRPFNAASSGWGHCNRPHLWSARWPYRAQGTEAGGHGGGRATLPPDTGRGGCSRTHPSHRSGRYRGWPRARSSPHAGRSRSCHGRNARSSHPTLRRRDRRLRSGIIRWQGQ